MKTHIGEGSGEPFRFSRLGKQSGFARVRNQASVYGSADRNEALASLSTDGGQRDKSLFHLTAVRFLKSEPIRASD